MSQLPTVAELADALEALQSRIESLSMKYEYQLTWDQAVADAGRLEGSIISGSYECGLMGDKRFRKCNYQSLSTSNAMTRSHQDVAFDGQETRSRLGRTKVQVQEGKHHDSGNPVCVAIGWATTDWDHEQIAEKPEHAVFFPSVLRHGNWSIKAAQLGSYESVVLATNVESGIRAWFGMKLGPCLIRLEVENPWNGIARQTRAPGDFEHFSDAGLSLPRSLSQESVVIDYASGQYIGLRTSSVTVSEYCVNEVDPALFSIPIAEETRVFRVA